MEELNKSIDDVINTIINSKEYKTCLELKDRMSDNTHIIELVNKIKTLQKKYIKSQDKDIKKELDLLEQELNSIPIYHIYNINLEIVNNKILYVKDTLNNYFDNLLNNKKN